MFEKSLYDLIRGLRARKGDERAYILESLKECRNEAKSQDGDIKATAILKLIYLEMFGHDMSWASFHVLEVMSSPKFLQKRIGYLAAIQSFTLDTDVLMLATNLLKKDLSSASPYDISLAINGLSHIVSPSLARDLSSDLITKMNHTNPYIRKKAILVMYKCFLQSPELLRTAWPRLREGLNDEDSSVVNATVNVICELARKNPRNYLPLAPQLFALLTTSKSVNNNWMTIKIIKLFATLTPLEPRLTKKLVPPITNIIKTTPAMSLLYECINGLISGGLLAAMGDTEEGEELASVCVTKLRGFLVEGDSNLKYVGLLALTKIVSTHPHLVALHQDVILDCIDDLDITIRLRALELVVGMVSADNLQTVVGRLMRQLRPPTTSPMESEHIPQDEHEEDEGEDSYTGRPKPAQKPKKKSSSVMIIPESYKFGVVKRILEMCSRDMYANITDFEWYLDVLVQLVRLAPPISTSAAAAIPGEYYDGGDEDEDEDEETSARRKDVGEDIGYELRNVAVRVKTVRGEAVRMADLLVRRRDGMFPVAGGGGRRVLLHAGWIVGEYALLLPDPTSTLHALIASSSSSLPADILAIYIQAIPKIYATVTGSESIPWTPYRKSTVTLLTDSVVKFIEPHASSPDLEVQERAVEFLELFRLAAEAIATQPSNTTLAEGSGDADDSGYYDNEPPRLLTQAIPSMFSGMELNPVAPRAQRKVPIPPNLDLDSPINPNLHQLISQAESFSLDTSYETDDEEVEFQAYYYRKPTTPGTRQVLNLPASATIDSAAARGVMSGGPGSYQYQTATPDSGEYLDPDIIARRRRERNRDDPYYIGGSGAFPSPNPLRGEEVDVDSIPVLPLDLGVHDLLPAPAPAKKPQRIEIVKDEGLDLESNDQPSDDTEGTRPGGNGTKPARKSHHHPLLGPQATGLVGFSLEESQSEKAEKERQKEEVRRAKMEVERFRREMERVEAGRREKEKEEQVKAEAGLKKKKKKAAVGKGKEKAAEGEEGVVKKKKKVKVRSKDEDMDHPGESQTKIAKKKKPKAKPVEEVAKAEVSLPPPPSSSPSPTKRKTKEKKSAGDDDDDDGEHTTSAAKGTKEGTAGEGDLLVLGEG